MLCDRSTATKSRATRRRRVLRFVAKEKSSILVFYNLTVAIPQDMVISESSSKPQRRRSLHASNIKDALDQLRGSSLKSSSLQPFKTSPLKIGTTTSSIPSSSSPLSSSSPSSLPLYSSSLSSSLSSSALPKIGSKRIQTMKDFQQGMSQAARLISGNKGLRFGLRSGKSKGKGGRRRSTFDSVSSW